MPTRIFRRTPATEEAASYGYGDMLKEIISTTLRRRSEASSRLLVGRPTNEDLMELMFAGVGAGTKIARGLGKIKGVTKGITRTVPEEATRITEKYKSQGLTYDAYVNLLPDKPEWAYHQWTFRGKGPLKDNTFTTKGTSADEFEAMVLDRLRKFGK